VLGANGQIAEQGTYDGLRQQDGFIQSILLRPAPSSNETFLYAKNMNSDTKPPIKEATARDQAQGLARRTGDMAVYRYYMKSIGWRKATVFAGFAALAVFASSFSRGLQVSLATLDTLLMNTRGLAKLVGRHRWWSSWQKRFGICSSELGANFLPGCMLLVCSTMTKKTVQTPTLLGQYSWRLLPLPQESYTILF
jgi:hypothetical protein